jgi:hypothetical protein
MSLRRAPPLAFAALLAACAVAPVTTQVQSSDPAAFARARSYALEPPPAADDVYAGRLKVAVEGGLRAALERKGYRAAAGVPDLRVAWRVVRTGRVPQDAPDRPRAEAHTPIGPGDPYAGYRAPAGSDGGATAGLLLVTVTDSGGRLVWQAVAEGLAAGEASALRTARHAAEDVLKAAPQAAR